MKRAVLVLLLTLATGLALADVTADDGQTAASEEDKPAGDAAGGEAKAEAGDATPKAESADGEKGGTDKGGQGGEKPKAEAGAKLISGMSVLGNQEAPKSLVIVPWKSSELGAELGISPMLDDSRQPIDKEVFMRALSYYRFRSGTSPQGGPDAKK